LLWLNIVRANPLGISSELILSDGNSRRLPSPAAFKINGQIEIKCNANYRLVDQADLWLYIISLKNATHKVEQVSQKLVVTSSSISMHYSRENI